MYTKLHNISAVHFVKNSGENGHFSLNSVSLGRKERERKKKYIYS
jgi:hypothetical protein